MFASVFIHLTYDRGNLMEKKISSGSSERKYDYRPLGLIKKAPHDSISLVRETRQHSKLKLTNLALHAQNNKASIFIDSFSEEVF